MTPNAKHNGFPHTNTDLVFEYFRLISKGNIHSLLNLFTDDCIIYEPFSKLEGGLKGKSAVEPFLQVAMMATSGMHHEIEIELEKPVEVVDNFSKNGIAEIDGHASSVYGRVIIVSALVTFHLGDKVRGRFKFEIVPNYDNNNNDYNGLSKTLKSKIKRLDIQFIE